jgi:hypothetical protein
MPMTRARASMPDQQDEEHAAGSKGCFTAMDVRAGVELPKLRDS